MRSFSQNKNVKNMLFIFYDIFNNRVRRLYILPLTPSAHSANLGGIMSVDLRQKYEDVLTVNGQTFSYSSLPKATTTLGDVQRLPKSLKILLENLLRF